MVGPLPLRPFDADGPVRRLEVSAALRREPGQPPVLELQYRLQGLAGLRLPPPAAAPDRSDGLWQHTCFEAFLGAADQEAYWEFNLSPSGQWAVYRLQAYRQGLQPELYYPQLPFALEAPAPWPGQGEPLILKLSCPLPPPLQAAQALRLGLTAVLEGDDGRLDYWALAHPGAEADFHDRRGWTLHLPL